MSCLPTRSTRGALRSLHCSLLAGLALAAGSAFANPNDPSGTPDVFQDFPVGVACANFDLRLELWNGKADVRNVRNRNGYTRMLIAGTGAAFRLTNLQTGKSLSTQSNGSSELIQINNIDGSTKYVIRGHSLLIWFPTDMPAGPRTILNSGNLSLQVDAIGVGSQLSIQGNSTDVCAALN